MKWESLNFSLLLVGRFIVCLCSGYSEYGAHMASALEGCVSMFWVQ